MTIGVQWCMTYILYINRRRHDLTFFTPVITISKLSYFHFINASKEAIAPLL